MKKIRKGKKTLIMMLLAIILIVAVVLIITKVVNKKPEKPTEPEQKQEVILLPETKTKAGLDAEKVYMEYLKDNNQTLITMKIINNTSAKVPAEKFNAILIGPDENVLGQMPTETSTELAVGQECSVLVVYKGDLTATQRIKLEPMQ